MSTTGTAGRRDLATAPLPAVTRAAVNAVARLRAPGTLALACVLVLAVALVVQPQFDPDYWWHVLVGERILGGSFPRSDPFTFTATGHAFIVQEWGSEVLFALLTRLGVLAVVLVMAAVTLGGFLLALDRARQRTDSNAVLAVVAALGLAVGDTVLGPRPQMFSFALLALALWLLDRYRREGGRAVWLLVPLFAAWGNLHGGFSLGLGLVAVVMVADAATAALGLGAPPAGRLRTMVAVFAVCALAVCINPNGPAVYLYAGGLLSNPVAQSSLDEWRSPSFHDADFIPLAVLIAALLVVASRARRADLADVLLAAAGVVLSLYAVRNLAVVVVTSMPLLAAGLDGILEQRRERASNPRRHRRPLAAPFCAAVLAAAVGFAASLAVRHASDPLDDPRSPAYAVVVADRLCAGPPTRLLQPYGAAGWLLYELGHSDRPCAADRVFIFGDAYVIGPVILADYLDAAAARPDTQRILDGYGVETVWQPRGSPLGAWLARAPGWSCIFADAADVVYTRSATAGRWPSDHGGCTGLAA